MIDVEQIESTIKEELSKKIKSEIDNLDINDLMESLLFSTINDKVETTVNGMINNLIKDGSMLGKISAKLELSMQAKLDDMIRSKVSGMVSQVDLGTVISKKISEFVQDKMINAALPDNIIPSSAIDVKGMKISADQIQYGTIKSFQSTGIQDMAASVELTILDGSVVVENNMIAGSLSIDGPAEFKSSLNLCGDLRLEGDLIMLSTKFKDQISSMVDDRIAKSKEEKIDIGAGSLLSNGKEVLTGNSLGPGVAFSNLRKLGNLQELNVIGPLTSSETLYVNNGRVGVNTDQPSGVFSLWDEDAELTIRKHKAKTTYVGTTRDCDLVLGTNGNAQMSLRKDGSVSVNKIHINGIMISVENNIPERQGSAGELVIISAPAESQPWAYQCLGGNTWTALKR